ncbi:hypothetical protein FAGAP_11609 [Fusarium agapanthi]|uniref:Uncharacterized protein n=1 Tax=Fusarium agapanthi TaxID=1803897 RepID=A0A9P5E3G8_9HYPO|nr:hypothetical protein FAGAP_11609 [Fusarium agapanthi]
MSTTSAQVSPAKAHIARLDSPYTLTPVRKRRTRPSFSPQKTQTPHQQKASHKTSLSLDLGHGEETSPAPPIATAALEFKEFSFRDSEGDISAENVTDEQHLAFRKFLFEHYNATELQESFPFLAIGCKGGPPPEDQRPFSVAGAIAIWLDAEDFYFRPIIGHKGQGEVLVVDDTIVNQIEYLQIPSQDIILSFAKLWPECLAISVLWTFLVIELPLVSPEEFAKRLETLPSAVEGHTKGCHLHLMFNNGPLPNTERRRTRVVKPDPRHLDNLIADETDYVTKGRKFYPGTMIGSVNKDGEIIESATAGILIEKDGKRRLTCSFHLWEKHYKQYPEKFGKLDAESRRIYKVVQGYNPGSHVGFVCERVGETDIALIELNDDVVFENKFMEIDAAPKVLLHSKQHRIGDEYIFDSFVSGTQTLSCLGERFTPSQRSGRNRQALARPTNDKGDGPLDDVMYIAFEQGAFVTNAPTILKKPQIRDSVCGSVLLRSKAAKRPATKTMAMQAGEVGCMMHFADLQFQSTASADNYIIYADSFDPLINDGWKVVQDPVENEGDNENDGEDDGEEEESPSKKRKAH